MKGKKRFVIFQNKELKKEIM